MDEPTQAAAQNKKLKAITSKISYPTRRATLRALHGLVPGERIAAFGVPVATYRKIGKPLDRAGGA